MHSASLENRKPPRTRTITKETFEGFSFVILRVLGGLLGSVVRFADRAALHALRVISISWMPAFIEAVELRKTYRVGKIDVPALRGISFMVQKGEFVSVVGPSGSGKSTIFYLLGGLTRADSGHVVIDGDDFAQLSDAERTRLRKRKIGFVFQKFNLLPTLDAQSNIEIAREISGNGQGAPAHFNRITDLLGLTKRLRPRPYVFFGGEQQRVALARALINKPAVVLADEPAGNLD